jgi:isoquinoline 1-oxidoreductase alpha subunit
MTKKTLVINGKEHSVEADGEMPLLWVIRDLLDLKGTKFGCGKGLCGSCTVHLDGEATRSCQTLLSDLGNEKITTIEGLGGNHKVQDAWAELTVPQCGYCQSGQIMSTVNFLNENKKPTEDEIDEFMSGNICRCGTYQRIKKAIQLAATK